MYSEFSENATFTGNDALSTGDQILEFYEIADVDRGHDLITLFGYYLVVNVVACVVLVLWYNLFAGKIESPIIPNQVTTEQKPPTDVVAGEDQHSNGTSTEKS